MGAHYQFKCPGCKYESEVSGGEDCGFTTRTLTMICGDCGALVDVITRTSFPDARELVGKCPQCKSEGVKSWDSDMKPCPKCGQGMKKGELVAFWD